MSPKDLVKLRQRLAANLDMLGAGGPTPVVGALANLAQRLDAIEDALGMSYVAPPHQHRTDYRISMRDGREVRPCAERGCGAYRVHRTGEWVEPEDGS